MCHLLESDEATLATLVLLILWAVGVFIYDQWWKRRGEAEYKQFWERRPPDRQITDNHKHSIQ